MVLDVEMTSLNVPVKFVVATGSCIIRAGSRFKTVFVVCPVTRHNISQVRQRVGNPSTMIHYHPHCQKYIVAWHTSRMRVILSHLK